MKKPLILGFIIGIALSYGLVASAQLRSLFYYSGGTVKTNVSTWTVTAADPTLSTHLTTKEYVDTTLGGIYFNFFLSDTAAATGDYFLFYPEETGGVEATVDATIDTDPKLIKGFITETNEPTFTILLPGTYAFYTHAQVDTILGYKSATIYYELYKRTVGATEDLLITSENSSILTTTTSSVILHGNLASQTVIATDDRLVLKIYGDTSGSGNNPKVTIYMEGDNDCRLGVLTTLSAIDDRYVNLDGESTDITNGTFELNTSGDINLADDSYVWFDTNQTYGIYYNSDVPGLIYDPDISGTGRVTFTANTGATGDGTYQPEFNMRVDGSVYITNTTQGAAGDKYFLVDMTDGLKVKTGATHSVVFKSDNLLTASRTIQAPDLSGTFLLATGDQTILTTGTGTFGDLVVDTTTLVTDSANNKVGIGTASPNAPLEVKDDFQGVVGGFASGILHITNKGTDANDNAVITGHNSNSTNKQLWYLGSTTNTNDNIAFINRQSGTLSLSTNNTQRLTIDAAGNVGIGDTTPVSLFTVGDGDAFQIATSGTVIAGIWQGTAIDIANYLTIANQATGDVLYYTGSNWARLALGTAGQALTATGDAVYWSTISGAGDMLKSTYDVDEDNEIDVAGGGTEKDSWTQYAIPYLSASTTFGEITIATADYALTVNASADGYIWTDVWTEAENTAAGYLTTVAYGDLTGNPSDVITAGTGLSWSTDTLNFSSAGLTWAGNAIGVTVGGTGLTSVATGDILYSDTGNSLSALSIATEDYVLTVSSGVPIWEAAVGSGDITDVWDCSTGNCETLTAGASDSLNAGVAAGFEIPNAAAPTVDATGEMALDITSGQLKIYSSSAVKVFVPEKEICFALEDPVAADDDVPFYFPRRAITITDVYCQVDGGTSIILIISDGTNALEGITCDGNGAEDDGSIANGTFTSLERMEFDLATIDGTNTWLNACITYTITAD